MLCCLLCWLQVVQGSSCCRRRCWPLLLLLICRTLLKQLQGFLCQLLQSLPKPRMLLLQHCIRLQCILHSILRCILSCILRCILHCILRCILRGVVLQGTLQLLQCPLQLLHCLLQSRQAMLVVMTFFV
jgi:hypothetical protein